jgi:uncharacterized membrane protein
MAGPIRILTARPRLLIAAAFGIAVGLVVPAHSLATRLLLGWDCGIGLHLVLVAFMMAQAGEEDLQRRAEREDAGAVLVLGFFALAALASLVAIGAELRNLKAEGGPMALGSGILVGATILLSWLFAHTLFGLHYAHDYYAGKDDRKGLKFPGKSAPDYWDFLYFSFNLGAAAQTSDVQVEARRMRRFVLAHTILSFLFNTAILALAINVGASLLGGG